MPIAVLFPRTEYEAIAQRHASWRVQAQLRRADDVAEVVYYDEDEPARVVIEDVDAPSVVVILDPLAPELQYFCATETLRSERRSLRRIFEGGEASTKIAVRTWRPAQPPDLLPYIPTTARSVLHVGCGDGTLGARIKERQRCRVVGIGNAPPAIAKKRLDDVYSGDAGELVSILDEKFDCIVTAGVLEHMLDPWSLLSELRRLGATLVAGIPDAAARDVDDPAAQVRFFTRRSIEELIDIAGWKLERLEPVDPEAFIVVASG
jgi:SAM-dependent methyltransferase